MKDHVLKFTTDDKGKHKAIVSLGFGKDTAARLYLADAEYKEISVTTLSGYVTIQDVNAGTVNVSASSGDIDLESCDAEKFDITTSSGDVDMEITAGRAYRFETKTNSGAVDVPDGDADSDYLCKIVTSSGDVDVKQK